MIPKKLLKKGSCTGIKTTFNPFIFHTFLPTEQKQIRRQVLIRVIAVS